MFDDFITYITGFLLVFGFGIIFACSAVNAENRVCLTTHNRAYVLEMQRLNRENKTLKQKLAKTNIGKLIARELYKLNERAMHVSPKYNSVNLLLGRASTKESDFGLMYQRDFDFTDKQKIRGSFGVTTKGSWYLGLGLNF